MKILVTGGAGFIGSNLVDRLVNLGHEVYVVDNLSTGKYEYVNEKIDFIEMDLNSDQIDEVILKISPEAVFHFAAQVNVTTSIENPVLDSDINIGATVRLLSACAKAKVKRFVYASSAAIYGIPHYLPINEEHTKNPISYYGVSKWVPELYIPIFSEMNNMEYTILRYSNVFGPRQAHIGEGGVISIFVNKLIEGQNLVVYGDGEQTRDFIYVKDIVEANIKALSLEGSGVFNISSNTAISLNSLITILENVFNKETNVNYENEKRGDIKHSKLDNSLAIKELKWHPQYSIEQGLEETIAYYKKME